MKDGQENREYIRPWNELGPYSPKPYNQEGPYTAKTYKEDTYKVKEVGSKERNRPFY